MCGHYRDSVGQAVRREGAVGRGGKTRPSSHTVLITSRNRVQVSEVQSGGVTAKEQKAGRRKEPPVLRNVCTF